ncbi:hypothetical protein KC330_g3074 [Hortaea werneckii]|nr:hypothetical protein KC330_g3074 [Hortaea werneckii]
MDVVQDWAAYLLNDADLSHAPYLYRLYSAAGTAKSWLLTLIDQVSQKPDLATIALLLIIVLVSLKILDMLWQTLLFWMRFRNRLSTTQQIPPSDLSSEEPSEYSALKRNRPLTRHEVPSRKSNSDGLSEQSAEEQMCSEEEHEAVKLEWKSAKSFQELLDLNRKFLRSESKRSCYHRAPIFNETVALVPGLLRPHDYGMLTVESQPSEDTAPTWEDCPCCPFEGWFQNQQRPYLAFVLPHEDQIPKEVVQRFLVELLIDDDFYVHVWRDGGSCRWGNCRKNIRTASSFPQDWTTNIRKQAKEKEGVASVTPTLAQRLDLQCGCQAEVFQTHDNVMEDARPLLVRVLAKSWEESDLQALVENAAVRAGVQPLYAVEE